MARAAAPHSTASICSTVGASEAEIRELLRYDEHAFTHTGAELGPLPLADEPFVGVWADWLEETPAARAISTSFTGSSPWTMRAG